MSNRINFKEVDPEGYKTLFPVDAYIAKSRIQPLHRELIKIRASQINGCSYCIDTHTKDARKLGETEQRIYALNAWRETPFFSEEEQAILAMTEEVTLIAGKVSDATYERAARLFDDHYIAQLILAIILINAYNRVGIATGMGPSIG